MRARSEARPCQRSRQQVALVNRQFYRVAIADVEIGMRREERCRLLIGGIRKALDIVMAVALGVGDADQRAEREILLHGKAGLTGEILAGDEEPAATGAPLLRAGRVQDRLVDALAGFRG